jgi:hypothetical protein
VMRPDLGAVSPLQALGAKHGRFVQNHKRKVLNLDQISSQSLEYLPKNWGTTHTF